MRALASTTGVSLEVGSVVVVGARSTPFHSPSQGRNFRGPDVLFSAMRLSDKRTRLIGVSRRGEVQSAHAWCGGGARPRALRRSRTCADARLQSKLAHGTVAGDHRYGQLRNHPRSSVKECNVTEKTGSSLGRDSPFCVLHLAGTVAIRSYWGSPSSYESFYGRCRSVHCTRLGGS